MTNTLAANWMWPWWYTMVAINAVQVAACIYFYRQSLHAPDAQSRYVKWMRVMGLLFVLIAFYRSIFVSRYLYQYAWFDTLFNSALLIRTFAWCAEISFSCLIAFAMLRFNKDLPDPQRSSNPVGTFIRCTSPYVLIICIFLAQFFATAGLILKSRMAFAIEETLWGIGFFSILPLAYIQCRRVFKSSINLAVTRLSMLKAFASINIAWCIIYCTYSLVYHLPTEYWATAFEQIATGIPEIRSGFSAVADAFSVVNVTHNYEDWGFGFVFWHSSYFTVCVWIALFLMRAPRLKS
jgi:hypothetical protein